MRNIYNRLFKWEPIGIKDINGKEICEGDAVEYIEKMDDHGEAQKLCGIVFYDETFAAFGLTLDSQSDCANYFFEGCIRNFKIVE